LRSQKKKTEGCSNFLFNSTTMKISKFLFSTLVAAAAMTSTAFAEGTVSISGTEYDSFDAAFNAAKEGDVLNISGSVGVGSVAGDINKSVDLSGSGTIDLGEKNFIIGYKTNDAVVTITEDSDISFTNGNGQGVIVSGARENDRFNGTFIIDNARVSMDYLLNRNITTIKGDGSGIISEKANLSLTKGVIIGNRKAETGGAGLGLFTLTDNAYVKISDNTGHATEIGYENGDGHLVVEKNSTFDNGAGRAFVVYVGDVSVTTGSALIAHSVELKSDTALLVSDSTLTAKSVFGSGRFVGNGAVNLNADRISQQIFIGGTYDEANNRVYSDVRSTVTLGDVSGNGITISDKEFRVNNADIVLNANVTAELGNGTFLYLRKSTLDLNGHDLVINSGKFLSTGLDIVGKGTITIDNANDQPCWQTFASSIGTGVTLKGTKQFCIYEDLTVYGKLQNEGKAGNGTTHIGFNDDFWTDGAILKISGKDASVSQTGGAGVIIHGADVAHGIESSGVVVEDGGTVDWASAGTVTNNGFIEVGAESSLTANVITGTGDVVLAGTINVGESLTTGNLTIVAGATLNIGPMVALFSVNTEENSLSFDTLTIVDEEGTLINDNGDLDLSSILSDESTGTSALLSAIKSKASESEGESPVVKVQDKNGSVFDVEFTVGENGEISATVVPEPSAFGLLAGLGAIALAVSRRRRSR